MNDLSDAAIDPRTEIRLDRADVDPERELEVGEALPQPEQLLGSHIRVELTAFAMAHAGVQQGGLIEHDGPRCPEDAPLTEEWPLAGFRAAP